MVVDLFAGIPVKDYAAALAWYERLLGSPPTFFPNDIEAVWARGAPVPVHRAAARACRHAMHTIFVDDFDVLLARIADRGLEPAELETYSNGVRKAIYRDPDGN